MTRRTVNGLRVRLLMCILVGSALSGCATFNSDLNWQRLGVRPDEPKIGDQIAKPGEPVMPVKTDDKACGEYPRYFRYSQGLMEAYHSRATQNRVWIYVAGITGLGVAAASGALGAATAVGAGTLALLGISGGFAGGAFATIDNQDLAKTYTIAANRVDRALKESEARRLTAKGDCTGALIHLKAGVSDARRKLEKSRTDIAYGALDRAKVARKELDDLIKEIETDRLAASPDELSIDTKNEQKLAVMLKGGQAPYELVRKPDGVSVEKVGDTTNTFLITVPAATVEKPIVFIDGSQPPQSVEVPLKKKPQ